MSDLGAVRSNNAGPQNRNPNPHMRIQLTATISHRFPRYIALPAVSAGIIGGAALGMAGMANASTYPSHDPTPRTGIVAKPETKA